MLGKITSICFLLLLVCNSTSVKIKEFFVKRQGSETNSGTASWPVTCNLRTSQSPINLPNICNPSFGLTIDPSLRVDFVNYDQVIPQQTLKMKNDGFSASLYIRGARNVRSGIPGINGSMTGGDFYQFSEAHFHSLSEHRIEGDRQPLEAQLVHFNTRYRTKRRAQRRRDGLLILSVLFREIGRDEDILKDVSDTKGGRNSSEKQEDPEDDPGDVMRLITDHLSGITRSNSDCQFRNSIRLSSLLPSSFFTSFYTYRGSTTSPPCLESVIWVISAYMKPIQSKHLCQFAHLDLPGEKRDVQSLNSRTVYVNSLACCQDINWKGMKETEKKTLSYSSSQEKKSVTASSIGSFWNDFAVNETDILQEDDVSVDAEDDADDGSSQT